MVRVLGGGSGSRVATRTVARPKIFERAVKFVRSTWAELRKVHWPNRRELVVYTAVVIVSVLIVTLILWVMDSIFSFLLGVLL